MALWSLIKTMMTDPGRVPLFWVNNELKKISSLQN